MIFDFLFSIEYNIQMDRKQRIEQLKHRNEERRLRIAKLEEEADTVELEQLEQEEQELEQRERQLEARLGNLRKGRGKTGFARKSTPATKETEIVDEGKASPKAKEKPKVTIKRKDSETPEYHYKDGMKKLSHTVVNVLRHQEQGSEAEQEFEHVQAEGDDNFDDLVKSTEELDS